MRHLLVCLLIAAGAPRAWSQEPTPVDLAKLEARAVADNRARVEPKGILRKDGGVEIHSSERTFLATPEDHGDVRLDVSFRIDEAAKHHSFFGEVWAVWPGADDALWLDHGFEALVGLRESDKGGYRVQVSHRRQAVALAKYPHGGYLRVAAAEIRKGAEQRLSVTAAGNRITVSLDGRELIRFLDAERPLAKGRVSIGSGSLAKTAFRDLRVGPAAAAPQKPVAHTPAFSLRPWLGDRPWLMDGDEPIMVLPTPDFPCFANVKLRPGWKPLVIWNANWELDSQGGDKELSSRYAFVDASGGGKTITLRWKSRHVKDRFEVRSSMTVGYDEALGVYTYDVDSELEVLPGEPFRFRNSIDFEHHTPLDPFNWAHLVARLNDGRLARRPLRPEDPGPMRGLALDGMRLLYGRRIDDLVVCPKVEYGLKTGQHMTRDTADRTVPRILDTGVCAAFYDTGVCFSPETLSAGTKIPVRYRYTALPAEAARREFEAAKVYDSPTLDPAHAYVFIGGQWPTIRFDRTVPLDAPWWGGQPFLSGHNRRPTCAPGLVEGAGRVLRFGPGSYAAAYVSAPTPLQGTYTVRAKVKLENVHGPGPRMELLATDDVHPNSFVRHATAVLQEDAYPLGSGTSEWRTVKFLFRVPPKAKGMAIAFANPGTGQLLVSQVDFEKLPEGAPAVAPEPPKRPASASVPGLIADYRMEEGSGWAVANHAGRKDFFGDERGDTGLLWLSNLDWAVDEGRPALRFADRPGRKGDVDPFAGVARETLLSPGMRSRTDVKVEEVAYAVAGQNHGWGEAKALSISTWIKPDAAIKPSVTSHGDLVGFGVRKLILSVYGPKAPYRLGARLDVNDELVSKEAVIEAGRWVHVGVSTELQGDRWTMILYAGGREVGRRQSERQKGPVGIAPSVVLGAEIAYLHSSYYRGLIGRTLILDRALTPAEMKALAEGKELAR